MSSFKKLHQFQVFIEKEVEEVTTKSEGGQEITIKTKVKKKVPVTIAMKELTRRERGDLSVWYAKNYNEALNIHGLSPRVFIIQKFLRDPNNPISDDQDRNLSKMYEDLETAKNDYMRVSTLPEDEFSKDQKEKIIENFVSLQKKVIDIETAYKSIFAHTAENYAQSKAITWLVLFLSYIEKSDGNYEPLFAGKDFTQKEETQFNLEDRSDPIYTEAVEKLSTYWGLHYFGQANNGDDFKKIEEEFAKQLKVADKEKTDSGANENSAASPEPEAVTSE